MVHNPAHYMFSFGNFLCCAWVVAIPRNGALRQWFIVVTIRCDFGLLKSLLAGINTTADRYGPNNTYPCVFNMKRRTYPYLLKRKYALLIFFFPSHNDSWRFSEKDGMWLNALSPIFHDTRYPKKFARPEILTWNGIFLTNYVMCKYLCNNQKNFICKFTANQVILNKPICSNFF